MVSHCWNGSLQAAPCLLPDSACFSTEGLILCLKAVSQKVLSHVPYRVTYMYHRQAPR